MEVIINLLSDFAARNTLSKPLLDKQAIAYHAKIVQARKERSSRLTTL